MDSQQMAVGKVSGILLVEDALDLAQVIARELRAEGFQVAHVADGLSAWQWLERATPDLVILDWMLPKMSGLDVLRRLRQSSAVPVLMLTARGEEIDRVTGLEVGADDYLSKPFGMRELVARVHALLRRAERIQQMLAADRRAAKVVLVHGSLVLDPQAHLVTIANTPIELSRTEFDLLHLLLRNPGRAFGRAYLLETVWDAGYVGGDRSVDNAMLRLRKKLGALGEDIETVWGVGYRLRSHSSLSAPPLKPERGGP